MDEMAVGVPDITVSARDSLEISLLYLLGVQIVADNVQNI